jgi:elongation factor Ts
MNITASLVKELRTITGAGMMDCKKALVETDGDIEHAIDWLREKGISKAAKKADRIAAEGLCEIVENDSAALMIEINSETDFVAKNKEFLDLLNAIATACLNAGVDNLEDALNVEINGEKIADVMISATARIGEKLSFRRLVRFEKTDNQNFGLYKHNGGKITAVVHLEGGTESVATDVAMHVAAINPKYLDADQIPADVIAHEKEVLTNEALNEGKPANIVEKMVVGRLNKYLQDICLLNQGFVKDDELTVAQFVKKADAKVLSFVRYEVGEGIEKREDNFAEEVMSQVNK